MPRYRGPVLSRRTLLGAAVVGFGGTLLAACGGAATTPAAQSAAQPASSAAASGTPQAATGGATTKLVFWKHQYEPTDKVFRDIIFPDAKAKLNLEFDLQVQRDADYKTTMLPQLASGGGPDIFEATEGFRFKFSASGVYAPLDYSPWGGKAQWESYWQQGIVEALRVNGQDFAVPVGWTAIPSDLFVNGTDAQQAGIDGDIAKYQQTPISWAELGPWAAKMTKKDANGNSTRDGYMIQHGYGPDRTYDFWEPYFLQAGGKLLSADGKTSTLDTDQGIAAMQNLYNYVFKDGASMLRPQDVESGSAKIPKDETSSTTAMSTWAYATFKQLAPDTWQNIRAVLAPQVDPTKPRYESGPGWSTGVLAKSKSQAAAFKFLHLVVDQHGSDLFDGGGGVAPVQGWTTKYAGFAKLPDAAVWKKMSDEAIPRVRPQAEVLTQVQRAEGFQKAFEAVMFNKADIKAELTRWNKDVQDALSGL
jgi:ABC-type glycerol-3-phosphate transport system substrate-binding protein